MDIFFLLVMMIPTVSFKAVPNREEDCIYEKPIYDVQEGENLRITAHNLPERGLCSFWFVGCCYGKYCEQNKNDCDPRKYPVEVFNKKKDAPYRCTVSITNASADDMGFFEARLGGEKNGELFAECHTKIKKQEPSSESCTSNPWFNAAWVLSCLLCFVFGVGAHFLFQKWQNAGTPTSPADDRGRPPGYSPCLGSAARTSSVPARTRPSL